MTINISTASSRDLSGGLPQSMGSMPQPQFGRSLPCDGSMLEGALTRLANELYAAPPGGAAGGLPPLAVGATPTNLAAPNFAAPASAATPGGSAAGFGVPLSSPTFGALDAAPVGFNAPGGFKQSPFDSVGASPAVPEGSDFAPAPNSQSLGAGGGTATPAPPSQRRQANSKAAFRCPAAIRRRRCNRSTTIGSNRCLSRATSRASRTTAAERQPAASTVGRQWFPDRRMQ